MAQSTTNSNRHLHDDDCGHQRVLHDDHYDYIVDGLLHHEGIERNEIHGRIIFDHGKTQMSIDDHHLIIDEKDDQSVLLRRNARLLRLVDNPDDVDDDEKEIVKSSTKWDGDSIRFFIMIGLTSSFMLIELIVGVIIGSISLQADAFHMISDVIALIIAFVSVRATKSKEKSPQYSFGKKRMEVVGGLVNGVFLLAVCLQLTIEALQTFFSEDEAHILEGGNSEVMMIVGGIGLGINLLGLLIFSGGHGHGHSHGDGGHGHSHGSKADSRKSSHSLGDDHGHGHSHGAPKDHGEQNHSDHSHSGEMKDNVEVSVPISEPSSTKSRSFFISCTKMNLNMRGVFLHILGDALGSIAVLVSGSIISYTSLPRREIADPLASLFIVLIIGIGTIPLVCHSGSILLQRAPIFIDMAALKAEVVSLSGVLSVHDLHIWQLTEKTVVATLHLLIDRNVESWPAVVDRVKLKLHDFGVHYSTIQPEFPSKKLQAQIDAYSNEIKASEEGSGIAVVTTSSPSSGKPSRVDGTAEGVLDSPLPLFLQLDSCNEPVCGDDCADLSCCPPESGVEK